MKLSIVIVNYNVKYFLEQCLFSVLKAIKNMDAEVFVVDNNSVDGSCQMVHEKFPDIALIENKDNPGFSKANNQAIRISKGEYVLLLNPDTIVEEDTFTKCINYLDNNKDVGALGVKMIDGTGTFLPESKRGLPTPWVSFSKIFGLSRLFPKSRFFNRYHLGFLSNDEIHEIDVLPGAFMMLRKSVLDQTGLLDEAFFMYGEDIDLSYRIIKAGYKNVYFPDTRIIHYKGESTKKGSINYVMVFYNAMIIFAKKHFSKKNARIYSLLINMAIYFRASLSILKRFVKKILLPVLDAFFLFLGFYLIKPHWENYKFPDGGHYPDQFLWFVVPAYILIWLLSSFINGAYKKPVKISSVYRGILSGTITILIIYALLPETMRFSRALILIGTALGLVATGLTRVILHFSGIGDFNLKSTDRKKKIVIVGEKIEADRVYSILKQSGILPELVGYVYPFEEKHSDHYIGNLNQLNDIVIINKIEELIFCAKNLSSQLIINKMLLFSQINIEYKIAPPESISVIGSNSINTSGDFYTVNFNSIETKPNQRKKRFFDITSAFISMLFFPLLWIVIRKPTNGLKNMTGVLLGRKTWIGFFNTTSQQLPQLKPGVFSPADNFAHFDISNEAKEKLDITYAQNYYINNDLNIFLKNIRNLGKMQ